MENAKIGEWYDDEKYWVKNSYGSIVGIKLDEIVTEATRRGADQGKREAWEEVRKSCMKQLAPTDYGFSRAEPGSWMDAHNKCLGGVIAIIDAKLASLSQSSNEKV